MTPLIIGISGPTSSGKTSLATKASSSFEGVTHIAMDDFYKNCADAPMYGDIPNWDTVESVHMDELVSVLSTLRADTPAHIPIYSKPQSKRVGAYMAHPTPIILVEGAVIYSCPEIRDLCSLKIFIRTSKDAILHRYTNREKDYSIDTRYLTDLIFPNLDAYTEEHSRYADIVLDGTRDLETIQEELFSHLAKYIPSTHFS